MTTTTASADGTGAASADHDDHGSHHILPLWLLFGTWAALMFFTVLTVALAQLHLGAFELPLAMGIATIKALLVLLIFMHLGFDKGFHSLLIFGSLLFVFLFVSFVLIDRHQYQPSITAKDQQKLLQGE